MLDDQVESVKMHREMDGSMKHGMMCRMERRDSVICECWSWDSVKVGVQRVSRRRVGRMSIEKMEY